MKKNHHHRLFSFAAFAGLTSLLPSAHAEIDVFAEYRLGEAGTLGYGKSPQDSSGNGRHFTDIRDAALSVTGTSGVTAPGSTTFLDTSVTGRSEGWVGADYRTLPTDNFGYGIWVKAASNSSSSTRGVVFGLGDGVGSFNIRLESGGWRATTYTLETWGSTTPFVANQWIHLAVIRKNGEAAFYANGVAVAGATSTMTPVHDFGRLSVTPGNNTFFDGGLDAARVVTFAPGDTTEDIIATLKDGPVVKNIVDVGQAGGVRVAALSTDKVSHFRVGGSSSDSAVVSTSGGLSVVAGTAPKHRIKIGFAGPVATGVYPLITYTGSFGGLGFDGLQLDPLPGRLQGTLFHNTAESKVELHVTQGTSDITWTGAGNGVWGTGVAGNWKFTTGGQATTYFDGDVVRFDGTGSDTTVSVSAQVAPASVAVTGGLNYSFSGQGIAGVGSVTKAGAGSLTFGTPNSFAGPLVIDEGRVIIGTGGTPGNNDITNNGELEFTGTGQLEVAKVISGTGPIWKTGSGTLTLSRPNSFSGIFYHQAGVIKCSDIGLYANSVLGQSTAGTVVSAGATVDVHGGSFRDESFSIEGGGTDGAGAITNGGGPTTSFNAFGQTVLLTGDTVFGGSFTWDIHNTFDTRTTLSGPHKITKKGSGKVAAYATDISVKDIEITEGLLSLEYGTVVDNVTPGTITVQSGGTLGLNAYGQPPQINKPIVLNGGALNVFPSAPPVSNVIELPIQLLGGTSTIHTSGNLTLNGEISGSGSLVKTGGSLLLVQAPPTYTGGTRIEDGTITLVEPSANPTGPLYISATGKLSFEFLPGSIHQVSTCVVDGVQFAAGDYDVELDTTGRFSGVGILRVTTGVTGAYGIWASENGVAGSSPETDSDNDGISNGIEFVIGGDPKLAQPELVLPAASLAEAGYVTFVFNRSTVSAGSNPVVQFSTTLAEGDWTPAVNGVGGVTVQSVPAGAGLETVTVRVPRGTANALFLRLKVDIAP